LCRCQKRLAGGFGRNNTLTVPSTIAQNDENNALALAFIGHPTAQNNLFANMAFQVLNYR
jgi:hypothetical protein